MSIKSRVATAISLHYVVWLALFVLVIAIAFVALGGYLMLVPLFGPAVAAFIVAGGLVALLLAIGLVAWIVVNIRKRSKKRSSAAAATSHKHPQSEEFIEDQLRPMLGDQAINWARTNPGLLMVGALSAGVLLSISPSIRRTLMVTAQPMLVRRGLSALIDNND